jgi:hypothetical protein
MMWTPKERDLLFKYIQMKKTKEEISILLNKNDKEILNEINRMTLLIKSFHSMKDRINPIQLLPSYVDKVPFVEIAKKFNITVSLVTIIL